MKRVLYLLYGTDDMLICVSGDMRVSLAALMAWLNAAARQSFNLARSTKSRPDVVDTDLWIKAIGVLARSATHVHVFNRCAGGTSDSRDIHGCTMSLNVGVESITTAVAPLMTISANVAPITCVFIAPPAQAIVGVIG